MLLSFSDVPAFFHLTTLVSLVGLTYDAFFPAQATFRSLLQLSSCLASHSRDLGFLHSSLSNIMV
jgi:hypothetical protein